MAEINLLKSELQHRGPFSFGPKGLASLYVVAGILVLVLGVWGGLYFYDLELQKKSRLLEQQTATVDFEVGQVEGQRREAISFQRRLNNLVVLLDEHVFWTPVFEELEKFTFKGAAFNTLQVDVADHTFILTGTVSSYQDMGKLLLGLRQSSNVQGVTLQSSGITETGQAGYNFNLELLFDPKLFLK